MSELSPKQEACQRLMSRTLVHLRNLATYSWLRRARDRSTRFETELVHNLPVSMFEPEFVAHDVWFLNAQARHCFRCCSPDESPLYDAQVESIKALMDLLPTDLRTGLRWSLSGTAGPWVAQEASE